MRRVDETAYLHQQELRFGTFESVWSASPTVRTRDEDLKSRERERRPPCLLLPNPNSHRRGSSRGLDETVETVVTPPVEPPVAPPVPPPGGLSRRASRSWSRTSAAPRYVTTDGERVLVDDPGGTRVVTRGVRTPLPPDEDPRRWNWLTPALVFILLAALGIVLAAIVLSQDDDKKNTTTQARPNTVTTTVPSNTTPPPANVSIQVPSVVGRTRADAEDALDTAGLAIVVATVPGPAPGRPGAGAEPAGRRTR